MRMVCLVVLLTVLLVCIGCSTPTGKSYVRAGYDFSKIDLVAIVDVVGDVESEVIKSQIADMFSSQLLNKGYAPVEFQYTQRQLRDRDFRGDDLSPGAYAIKAGQVLDVPAVMLIEVPLLDNEISLKAKILDIANGSAIWFGTGSKAMGHYSTINDPVFDQAFSGTIFPTLEQDSLRAQGQVQEESKKSQLPLSVNEAKDVEEVIQQICKSLPHKSERARRESFGGFDWSALLE